MPANVKFQVEKVLEDGSYLSWIAPDGKSKKKGGTKLTVRVIEYTAKLLFAPKTPAKLFKKSMANDVQVDKGCTTPNLRQRP